MEMCRACLTTGMGMVPIDENFLNKYNILTNLDITFTEDVPLYTCNTCHNGATFCIEFREKCIASDQTLKEILFSKTKQEDDEYDEILTTIKNEVKIEEETEFLDECYNYGEDYVEERINIKNTRTPKDRICKLKELSSDSKLLCGICPKKLKDKDDLTRHLDHHKTELNRDIICGLCTEQFISMAHMLGHRMVHVPKKQKKCHICTKKFLSAENLEFHYMRVHEMAEKDAPIRCKKCPKSFSTVKKLQKHMAPAHSESKYTCEQCSKRFRTLTYLKVHMALHETEPAYKCNLCDFVCKYPAGVRNHKLRKHTTGRVNCKTCGQLYANQELLDRHQCKHSLGVICPVCGVNVRAKSAATFNRHLLTHEDIYPYKCEKCPAKFKSKGTYQAHTDKHAGTPRWRCEHCQRSFYSQSALIKHRRTHTGEKPYVCEICSRGFTGNNNLKVHMKVHGIMNLIKKKNCNEES